MKKIVQTAGREGLGGFADEFARLNDDVLFGVEWNRQAQLPLKLRSLTTIVSLVSQGLVDSSLKFHLEEGKRNGITRSEIAEILTHNAFYAGWPKTWAAMRMAKEVWADQTPMEEHAQKMPYPVGDSNDAYAQWFSGKSYLAPVAEGVFNVTFEPGCQNNWHIHKAAKGGGQILVGVAGKGFYQEWGKEPVEMGPGTVIHIPANVKHWHGAAPDSWFSHLAIEVPGEEAANEWLEPSK